MHTASEKLHKHKITIGIECESLEGTSWGIGRLTAALLRELSQRPEIHTTHRFILYTNGHSLEPSLIDPACMETRSVGLSSLLGRWAPLSFSLYYYLLLPLRLWWDRPDAMYYPNYMLPIIHPPFVPSLVMLTEDVWHEMRNPHRALRYKLGYRVFATWASLFATRIMAISHASQAALTRLFRINPDRIVVNPLAVHTPPPEMPPRPFTHPYILYVGQAFERRHLRETLLAFRILSPQHPNLHFVIIGPDKYNPPIIATLISETRALLGRSVIVWHERVSDNDLHAWYTHASAIAYISDLEAFGLPPLEGLVHGTVPVVADTPISREIFGTAAFYVTNPSDAQDILTTLESAITDDTRRRAIVAEAETIAKHYRWTLHADRFLDIIQSVLRT